jgi:hypothetical protein
MPSAASRGFGRLRGRPTGRATTERGQNAPGNIEGSTPASSKAFWHGELKWHVHVEAGSGSVL